MKPIDVKVEIERIISTTPNSYTQAKVCQDEYPYQCQRGYLTFPNKSIHIDENTRLAATVKLKPFRTTSHFYGRDNTLKAYLEGIVFKGKVLSISDTDKKKTSLRTRFRSWWKNQLVGFRYDWLYYVLLTGDKSMMSKEDNTRFKEHGISHLLAISGMHVGIMYTICFWMTKVLQIPILFKRLQRIDLNRLAALFSLIVALLYVYLSGGAVSSVRAFIMLSCMVCAYVLRRHYLSFQVLLFALFLTVLYSPSVWFDYGFYLSYLACVAIIGVLKCARRFQLKNWFCLLLIIQVACFILLAPISAYFFQGISVSGIWVNLVAIPFLSFVLFPCLLLQVVLSCLHVQPFIFDVLDFVLQFAFTKLETIPKHLQWLEVMQIRWQTVVSCYLALLLLFFDKLRRFALLMLAFPIHQFLTKEEPLFSLVVFDVGHGTMVLLERNNQGILYDLGPSYFERFNYVDSVLLPFSQKENISIEYLILSHDDKDHTGGLDAFLKSSLSESIQSGNRVLAAPLCPDNAVRLENGLHVTPLWPRGSQEMKGDNNNSCVVLVEHQNYRILLAGDIEKEVENQLISNQLDKMDVLLVPHHGSKTSSSNAFINHLKPKYAIFSRAFYNPWRIPHPQVTSRYIEAGATILDTALDGDIKITFYENEMRVEKARDVRAWWFYDN
ncbi:DNA internalization-related competence protein ComEC/Rec2 [Pseudoalteromonas xiamenensis]|uniref:DNA internalization-related competence protein ComEC/Rec2 n=1 Tax=Pseudoalteromonas xiamenensis TaxID=882626 RepID=UPI0027E3D3FB|nr:DNA internalization-related competence protein ComEC/Rec2 [Pseudoalteromonas xiamenensis]WMN59906.1 DNA internalization-related competence protein ComEC/Rec2 [Pseudoalteromonas xiamenensis]